MRSSNWWSLQGFSRKSTAPSFMARTATGTSPCPVTMITGRSTPCSCSICWVSMPLMPGMRRSSTRQPGPLSW